MVDPNIVAANLNVSSRDLSMSLDTEIREHMVSSGTITLWWLGQEGFVFKSPGGKIVAVDPYLTNSCKDEAAKLWINSDRLFPPPILPSELDVNVIAFTHSHQDHCDPETIFALRAAGRKPVYVAPGETVDKLIGLGIPRGEILLVWPNKELRFSDVRIKAGKV